MIVVHYSEIGTKGKNRAFFENKLMGNLRKVTGGKVSRRYGRILCEKEGELSLMPGVSSYAAAVEAKLDLEEIKKKALSVVKGKEFDLFKVETKRSNKQFPLKSPDINREVGKFLEEKTEQKVDYKKADFILHIEIGEKEAFVYGEKSKGVGGLPVGTAGKVMASLSGGIDSPVASFLLMKRGCKVVFVHIHNKTQKGGQLSKIEDLVKRLSSIQLGAKLYIVPFEKIQKEIILKVPSKLRMIIYRRMMMRIINQLAYKENAKAIVTGDSVGQVASQTLENLECIYDASRLPVFNPLIGMNKEEIVDLGKKIGTYEISIQPYPDCCSFMIAQHPETKGKLAVILEVEKELDVEELVKEAVKEVKVKKF